MSELDQELEAIAGRVSELLEGLPANEATTAWDIKLKLRVALSHLYMALGMMQERGRVRITPDGLTYRIQPTGASKMSQPVVGIPLQISVPSAEAASAKNS